MSPIDLIPDFIPVIGYVDELILIPVAIALLIKMMPMDVLQECRLNAQWPAADKYVGWIGAIMIICIWAASIYLMYRLVEQMF